jgi:hypothetical protein
LAISQIEEPEDARCNEVLLQRTLAQASSVLELATDLFFRDIYGA